MLAFDEGGAVVLPVWVRGEGQFAAVGAADPFKFWLLLLNLE